jgi:hypothetical protein
MSEPVAGTPKDVRLSTLVRVRFVADGALRVYGRGTLRVRERRTGARHPTGVGRPAPAHHEEDPTRAWDPLLGAGRLLSRCRGGFCDRLRLGFGHRLRGCCDRLGRGGDGLRAGDCGGRLGRLRRLVSASWLEVVGGGRWRRVSDDLKHIVRMAAACEHPDQHSNHQASDCSGYQSRDVARARPSELLHALKMPIRATCYAQPAGPRCPLSLPRAHRLPTSLPPPNLRGAQPRSVSARGGIAAAGVGSWVDGDRQRARPGSCRWPPPCERAPPIRRPRQAGPPTRPAPHLALAAVVPEPTPAPVAQACLQRRFCAAPSSSGYRQYARFFVLIQPRRPGGSGRCVSWRRRLPGRGRRPSPRGPRHTVWLGSQVLGSKAAHWSAMSAPGSRRPGRDCRKCPNARSVVSDLPSDHHTTADALRVFLPLLLIPVGGFAGRRTRQ